MRRAVSDNTRGGGQRTSRGRWPTPYGFTVIEVLAVIGVLSVLLAMLVPTVHKAIIMGKVTRVRHELKHIGYAVENYYFAKNSYPPARQYCITSKRDLYNGLPPELWEGRYIDSPLQDLFAPGRTYRYTACGPGFVNDSPALIRCRAPETFPLPGGKMKTFSRSIDAPAKWIAWSVGPCGPLPSFEDVMMFNPYDPDGWYPRDDDGIVVHYSDGNSLVFP